MRHATLWLCLSLSLPLSVFAEEQPPRMMEQKELTLSKRSPLGKVTCDKENPAVLDSEGNNITRANVVSSMFYVMCDNVSTQVNGPGPIKFEGSSGRVARFSLQ